jgi:hypothetical protein
MRKASMHNTKEKHIAGQILLCAHTASESQSQNMNTSHRGFDQPWVVEAVEAAQMPALDLSEPLLHTRPVTPPLFFPLLL